jgi:uncharacterized membrane protein
MTPESRFIEHPPVSLERLRSFSDAIYAFSMTLLVTGLRLPTLDPQEATTHLFRALQADWRALLVYVISFLTISSYWLLHQTVYSHVIRTDRCFIWLNILLLLVVTFLPFPTALMGKYGRSPDTVFVYGVTISAAYLLINLIARYACAGRRLISKHLPERTIRLLKIRLLLPLIVGILGTVLAFSHIRLAFLLFFLMTLINNMIPWPPPDLARKWKIKR